MDILSELKRRNVFRIAIAYAVIAWLTMQVGDTMAPALKLPEWVNSVLAFFLILGFPVAIFFAWVFEMTPEGLKFERDVDRSQSKTQQTGKKVNRLIIVVLMLALAYFVADKFLLRPAAEDARAVASAGAGQAEAVIPDQSIAVLPFADLSPEGNQEYFSDGIAEEILNVLVRVRDLSVASRTSSFGFKGQEALGIPTIARKLKVRHVLEGSVRKSGDMIRVTAQLIDAQTDQHLWSETYDRTLTAESIFAIQDEIAKAIVTELGVLIDGTTRSAGTDNLDAYELYLKAHKVFIERSDILGAVDLFEQTVDADPVFGRAVAGLAAAYAIAPSWGFVDRDYLAMAEEKASEAIEIDPAIAIAWAVLGYVADSKRDYQSAYEWYDKALEVNPADTTTWLWRGILNNSLGFFDRAVADIDRCLELDPVYGNCMRHLARSKLFMGDTDAALRLVEDALLVGFPSMNPIFLEAFVVQGNTAVVAATISTRLRSQGYSTLIEPLYRALTDPDFDFEEVRVEIETLYEAATGDQLDWGLEDEYSALSLRDFDNVPSIEGTQVWWAPYPVEWRTHPRRKAIMIELEMPAYWRKHGFPPQCRPLGEDDFECAYERRIGVRDAVKRRPITAPQ